MTPATTNTRARILDVAEKLFSEEGVDRVSVRDVTEKAEVNVAAINYHFGSKEDLVTSVFERRLAPLNEARLKLLGEFEKAAGAKSVPVEKILEAFVLPAINCCPTSNGESGAAFAKLLGRCLAETKPEVESYLKEQFAPVIERFERALMKALPKLTRADVFWRLKFTFGALHHWLLTREKCIPSWAESASVEEQVKELIQFTAAGFRN